MVALIRRRLRGERGFTLIELLIVVAIIAILAAILIPNFLQSRASAQVSASKSNLRNLATAMEAYQADNVKYPAALSDLVTTYIGRIPPDPCSADPTVSWVPVLSSSDYRISSPTWGSSCIRANGSDGIYYTPSGGLQKK